MGNGAGVCCPGTRLAEGIGFHILFWQTLTPLTDPYFLNNNQSMAILSDRYRDRDTYIKF